MRLILLRHAKSSWKQPFDSDHSRKLNKRGREDAPRMGKCLRSMGWIPEIIFSSDSVRTRETWKEMGPSLAPDAPVRFTQALYHGGLDDIQTVVAKHLHLHSQCLAVIGHNPGWEQAASILSGQRLQMKTCNAALLECSHESWPAALEDKGHWNLVKLISPQKL